MLIKQHYLKFLTFFLINKIIIKQDLYKKTLYIYIKVDYKNGIIFIIFINFFLTLIKKLKSKKYFKYFITIYKLIFNNRNID